MFDLKKYLSEYRPRLSLFEVMKRDGWPRPPMVKSSEIILGDACNARCAFCCAHESMGSWQPVSKVKKMMERARREKHDMIIFSGGEPTIYPHFIEVIRHARSLGFAIVEVMTNGIKLADPRFAREAVNAGLTMAKIAVHGSSEKIHDQLTGVKGSFARALKAVDNLNALGAYPSTNMAVNRLNYRQLPLYCELFVKKMGLTGFCFYFEFHSGKMKRNLDLQLSYSEFLPYLRLSLKYLKAIKARIDWRFLGNFVPCLLPEYSNIMIDWGADYKNRNNEVTAGGKRIPVYKMYDERKRKMKKCASCIYGKICYGVDSLYLERYGEDEFFPVKKEKKAVFTPVYW